MKLEVFLQMLDWQNIKKPLLSYPFWSLKDPCVALHDGVFHLFCSAVSSRNHFQILHCTTKDLQEFSHPLFLWGEGDNGRGSPDISYIDGVYYLTYQSWDPRPGHDRTNTKCLYATSKDLTTWDTKDVEIARNLNVNQRAIDPAITRCNDRFYCFYKQWQTPLIASAINMNDPDGWELLGELNAPESTENGQFIRIDGTLRLIVDSPGENRVYELSGDETHHEEWAKWRHTHSIDFPSAKGFNETRRGGAVYVADWRKKDDHFYAFYHVKHAPEARMNMGHHLGIARSRELVHWELPGC